MVRSLWYRAGQSSCRFPTVDLAYLVAVPEVALRLISLAVVLLALGLLLGRL